MFHVITNLFDQHFNYRDVFFRKSQYKDSGLCLNVLKNGHKTALEGTWHKNSVTTLKNYRKQLHVP